MAERYLWCGVFRRLLLLTAVLLLFAMVRTEKVAAQQQRQVEQAQQGEDEQQEEKQQDPEEYRDEWMIKLRGELDLGQMDEYVMENYPGRHTFSEMVDSFLSGGNGGLETEKVTEWLFDLFFYEIRASRDYFLQMLVLTAVFAVVKQIMEAKAGYISEMSFLMIYVTMMAFLLKSFLLVAQVAQGGVRSLNTYLTVLVPLYASTLVLSGHVTGAALYYEMSFLLMSLLGQAMRVVFVPGIHIYLLLKLFDQLFEEERLSKLSELLAALLRGGMKWGLASVVGIGCIRTMLGSAQDQLAQSVAMKGMAAIPGVGNLFGSAGDIVLSCAALVRNSVGAAGLVLLLAVCMGPIVKTAVFAFLYRSLAAVLQPMADKRLTGAIHATGKAGEMYLMLLQNSMLLFFITAAIMAKGI